MAALRARLREQDEVLDAIRRGEVDAIVRPGPGGDQVFTRSGTDLAYRAMVETMAEGAVALSTDGDILYCNQRFAELVGEGLERIIGTPLRRFFAPADAARAESLLRVAQDGPARGHIGLRRAGGARLPVQLALRSLAAHGVPGIVAVVTDLSDLRRSEEERTGAARAALLYARSLLEASLDPLVTISPEGKITDVNKATEQATGLPRDRLVGTDFARYFTEPEAASAGYQAVLREGLVRDYPLTLRHVSGRTMDVLYNATTYLDAAGGVQGVFAAARDVTERKKAEELLGRTNRALRMIYAVNEAVLHAGTAEELMQRSCDLAIDVGGYRMSWIGRAEDMPGKPVRPIARAGHDGDYLRTANITWADAPRGRGPTGRAIREGRTQVARFITTDPAMAPWREVAVRHGYASSVALPLRLDAAVFGALMIYSGRPDAFDEDELRLLAAMAEDIGLGLSTLKARAEIRQLNAELERRVAQRTAQLDAANKDLEGFAYSVSHDLRAPLRAIDSFSKILLEEHARALDEEGQRLLNTVRRNTERMGRLIDDILEFSRAGRKELGLAEVDVTALVRDVLAELLPAAGERKVEVRVADLPRARADPPVLRQVLVNLLSNAIKFTTPRPAALIEVSGAATGAETEYAIRDNGVGFDPAYAHKLFGVFQRLHGADEFPGTGIGLAIVKRIVDKHGGRVWAESRPGEGATFHFSLPGSVPAGPSGERS